MSVKRSLFMMACTLSACGVPASIGWAGPPEELAASRARGRNAVKPAVRRRLLQPIDGRERLRVLQRERLAIENVTRTDIAPGMKDAILLQEDYLDGGLASLRQNLDLFLRTRGLAGRIEVVPYDEVQSVRPPAVLVGPNDLAGVLLGEADIDGERFASVFFPRTGALTVRSLTGGVGPRGLPDPNEGKDAPAKERLARLRAAIQSTWITQDPQAYWPASLRGGVRLCRVSSLTGWRVIIIDQIAFADN
jgi:hypothetical protein